MKELPHYDALVLEGGSLRCAFTAGVLDTFAALDYRPFQHYYGVSAGSMAMTSFLSGQRGHFIELSEQLVEQSWVERVAVVPDRGLLRQHHVLGSLRVRGQQAPVDVRAVA